MVCLVRLRRPLTGGAPSRGTIRRIPSLSAGFAWSDETVVFRSPTVGSLCAVVADHIVMSSLTFPGTGYLEMMHAAVRGFSQTSLSMAARAQMLGVTFERLCLVNETEHMDCQLSFNGTIEITSTHHNSSMHVHSRSRWLTVPC